MKGFSTRHMAMLLCGASAFCSSVAFAQSTGSDEGYSGSDGFSGNEIIVTATRQEQSLQDTPMAVDVVTGDAIQDLNLFDPKDISKLSPGLELANNGGRNNQATLRGITFDPDGGTSPAVEFFFNEIPADANTILTAMYDIGQIEILRGPQGLFRGRTSPAGSIIFGTRRPNLSEAEGYIQVTGTTESAANIQGAVSIPLVEDQLALRISGLYDDNDVSGVRNVDGRKSFNETYSGRASLAWQPSDAFHADLVYQYTKADLRPLTAVFGPGATVGGVATGPALTLKDRRSVIEGPFSFKNQTHLITFNSGYDFGGTEIQLNLGYQDSLLRQERDQDSGNAIPGYADVQRLDISYKLFNAELRLQSNDDSRLHWSLSGNYSNSKNRVPLTQPANRYTPTGVPIDSVLTGIGFYNGVATELKLPSQTYGLAGTLGYDVTDSLTITGGLRGTWFRSQDETKTLLTGVNAGVSPAIFDICPAVIPFNDSLPAGHTAGYFNVGSVGSRPFISGDSTEDPFNCAYQIESEVQRKANLISGGANVSWEVNPDLTVYASYGHTERSGPPSTAVADAPYINPAYLIMPDEKADGFEVGIKGSFLDRKLTLNLAAFYQKFTNFLSLDTALNFILDDTQGERISTATVPTAADAESKGFEWQLSYRPTSNIDLGFNGAYADAKYTSDVVCNKFDANGDPLLPPAPTGGDINSYVQTATCSGFRLAAVPKFTFNASGEIRFPTGSVEPFVRGLLNHRPGFTSDRDNYEYRSITKIDLFVGIRSPDDEWEITAFAKNLLDQARATSVSGSTQRRQDINGDFIDSGYRTAQITAPREFGITAKYAF